MDGLGAMRDLISDATLSEQEKLDIKTNLHVRMNATNQPRRRRLITALNTTGAVVAALIMCIGLFATLNRDNATHEPGKKPMNTSSVQKIAPLSPTDMRVGDLMMGMNVSVIKNMYGSPSSTTFAQEGGGSVPQLNYSKQGFSISGPTVWQITVFNGFIGSTPRGIHIGSSKQAVQKAYPNLLKLTNGSLYAQSPGFNNGIEFYFSGDKVSKITLTNLSDGTFWNEYSNPSLVNFSVLSVSNNEISVNPPSALWSVNTITITPQTRIWENGDFVRLSNTSELKPNVFYYGIVEQSGTKTIAKEIYGPEGTVYGIVSKVSGKKIIIQELSRRSGNLWIPIGKTQTLVYDLRTAFLSHPSSVLKPGTFITSDACGFSPGELLMTDVMAYQSTRQPNGTYVQHQALS